MHITEEELKNEKEYLEKVKNIINEEITSIKKDASDITEEILKRKKDVYFMPLSDDPEITDEINNINNKIELTNKKIDKLYLLEKSINNPYFGKLIIKGDSTYKAYIGINTVEKDYNYYVYDWRSPIASLFYNYGIGKASYTVDNKKYNCDILDKTQFKIKNGELVRCFKSEINIDDDYLQELLSNSSSKELNNIISTIQKEQNEIIRDESNNSLIVQGIAGSGKTVVAMHRIAYLLYRDKDLLSNDILIFSPNNIFLEYISSILPEMGEENTLASTFIEFSSKYIKESIENYSEFLERTSNKKDISIEFKFNCNGELDKFLHNYVKEFNFTRKFTINDTVFHSSEINELFNEKYKRLCFSDRINKITDYILLKLDINPKKYKKKIKKYLYSKINLSTNYIDIYNEFLMNNNMDIIDSNNIKYEDLTNLLYIYFYIHGYPSYSQIKYVVIDEVQDYTKNQLEILTKIFKYSKFIILGDINQNINPYYKVDSISDYSSLFSSYKYIELNKTYRSTENIINYSNNILGINNSISIRKNNNEEVEEERYSIDSLRKNIKKYSNNSIAIVTEDLEEAKEIEKNIDNIELIVSCNDVINSNFIVIPSYLIKGLEFDVVFVIKSSNLYDNNKNLYYVVTTRAKSKLIVYKK